MKDDVAGWESVAGRPRGYEGWILLGRAVDGRGAIELFVSRTPREHRVAEVPALLTLVVIVPWWYELGRDLDG